MKNLMLLFVAIISATCLAQAQNHYRITNLGVLPGDAVTYGYGLNNHGDVVGYCSNQTAGPPWPVPPSSPTGIQIDHTQFPFLYHAGKISNFAPNGMYGFKN